MSEGETATRALVIDDEPAIVLLVRAILHRMNGMDHIDSASKGDTAANLLDRNEYDVVILEAVVPYGQERLLGYLSRSRPSVCRRTIIITSAPVSADVLKEIGRAQPHAVLCKPFAVDALADAVRTCVADPNRHALGRTNVMLAPRSSH